MLACARLGAPHTVVFGGFSAEALSDRINDAEAKLVITADGGWRRGKPAALKPAVDEALELTPTIEHTPRRAAGRRRPARRHRDDRRPRRLVARHRGPPVRRLPAGPGRLASTCSTCSTRRGPRPSPRASCTRPRATCSGTSVTHEMVFDIKPDDVYWCAADIGWVTGHSLHRLRPAGQRHDRACMYEGTPDTPAWERWWQIIEDYKVTILYCAPTAIRAFMKQGEALRRRRTTCPRCASSARSASPSTPRPGSGTSEHIGGGTVAHRRHLVADRDRHDHDHAAARRDDDQARQRHVPVPGRRRRRRRRERRDPCPSAAAATSS